MITDMNGTEVYDPNSNVLVSAMGRWLHVNEIESLLDPNTTVIPISREPPSSPPSSGTLLLYDRSKTRNYKDDGYEWIKKRNSPKVREDHVKLRIQGKYRVAGCYVHCSTNLNMHRRAYHLLDPDTGAALHPISLAAGKTGNDFYRPQSLILIHYLDTEIAAKFYDNYGVQQPKSTRGRKKSPKVDRNDNGMMMSNDEDVSRGPKSGKKKGNNVNINSNSYDSQFEMFGDQSDSNAFDDDTLNFLYGIVMEDGKDDEYPNFDNSAQFASTMMADPLDQGDMMMHDHRYKSNQVDQYNMNHLQQDPYGRGQPVHETYEQHYHQYDNQYNGYDNQVHDYNTQKNNHQAYPPPQTNHNSYKNNSHYAMENHKSSNNNHISTTTTRPVKKNVSERLWDLPSVLDTTPDEILTNKPNKIVISCSDPVRLPEDSNHHFSWVFFFAFINMNNSLDFDSFLLTPCKSLNPYSYLATVPPLSNESGEYHAAILAVKVSNQSDPRDQKVSYDTSVAVSNFWKRAHSKNPLAGLFPGRIYVENPKTVSDVVFLTELFENALILTKPQPRVEIPPSIPQHTKKDTMTMNELGELLQPVANCDLPAPAAAMAVVAHGLADFPNPPQEAIMMTTLQSGGDDTSSESEATPRPADEKSISRKKRAYINDTEEVKQAASEWAIHRDSSDPTAETKAEEVDRHCKIRFVERLSNVIGTTEALVSTVPDPVLIEKTSTTIVADEENISDMDSEKLDDLLDSLLVRIVESLVEITDSSTELNEELNAPDRSGFTLLHYAALYNLQSLIPVLLSRGVNPDTTTLAGKLTPLHLACGAGNWAIVELLVRHGCALKMKDSFGATPADHAFRSGFPGISKWLKDKIDDQKSKISESIKEADESTSFDDASMSSSGHNKALMQSAFHNLNLKDKIAFKLMLEKRQRDAASRIPTSETIMEVEENELNGDASLPRNGNTSSVMKQIEDDDVGSVISTMDRESLDIAMKFMNEEELNELQSSNVDEDMKNWIISRNYLSLKKASENLRETVDKRKKQTATQPSPNHSSTASSVESKVLGDDKETRRQLKNMQSEALAALVLRKNLMKLAEKDANNKTSKSVNSV